MEYSNPTKVRLSKPLKLPLTKINLDDTDEDIETERVCNRLKINYHKSICSNNAQLNDSKSIKDELSKYLTNTSTSNNTPSIKEKLILNTKTTIQQHQMNSNHNHPYSTRASALHHKQMANLPSEQKNTPSSVKRETNTSDNTADITGLLFLRCMNCGNSISIEQIEKHSSKCVKVTEEVMINERNNHELYSIDYKLKKLREHLGNILNESIVLPKEQGREMRYYATILSEAITQTLHLEGAGLAEIKEYKKILKGLEVITMTSKAELTSLILIDRTKVLVNEKLKRTKEMYRVMVKEDMQKVNEEKEKEQKANEEKEKEQKIIRERHNEENEIVKGLKANANEVSAEKFICQTERQPKNRILTEYHDENALKTQEDCLSYNSYSNHNSITQGLRIETIISDVDIRSRVFSMNTSISNSIDRSQDNDNNDLLQSKNIDIDINTLYTDENNDKKDFYKMVFKIKFEKLHSSHKGQFIPHAIIWNECKRNNIPKDKWTKFILTELNNPLKYTPKAIPRKSLAKKQHYKCMPSIVEEKC